MPLRKGHRDMSLSELAHVYMVYAICYSRQALDICLAYAQGDVLYLDRYALDYLAPKYIQSVLPERASSLIGA